MSLNELAHPITFEILHTLQIVLKIAKFLLIFNSSSSFKTNFAYIYDEPTNLFLKKAHPTL